MANNVDSVETALYEPLSGCTLLAKISVLSKRAKINFVLPGSVQILLYYNAWPLD